MKNKIKYLLLLIPFLLLSVMIIIYILFFYNNDVSQLNEVNITYDSKNENFDFSDYKNYNVNLDKVSDKYTISEKGVYHISGSLNGYIEVNTEENVVLVLDSATITNTNGPCIYILSAKNTYIELVGENTLIDSEDYSSFEDVDGTIYSKDDLIIYGDGTLNLIANYLDGIVSKDDLVIYSGTYNIKSKDDAIRGKDSVTIVDGTFNIESDGDGIKSTNSEDNEKGYILIQNGTFNIQAGNDGFDAETNIQVDNGNFDIVTGGGSQGTTSKTNDMFGWSNQVNTDEDTPSTKGIKSGYNIVINNGTFKISSLDDGIHSNKNIAINDGSFTIDSDDDGIHADGFLEINGGTYTINSHEGIEGTYVKINDGTITINSTDDGINAGNKSDEYDVVIEINGGYITIKMSSGDTDGIDSNGDIIVNGGTIDISGNSAFDYDKNATYNGGTIIVNGEETNTITNQFMGGMQNNGQNGGNMQEKRRF